MISLETTLQQIFREVKQDMPHVRYALQKSYGGKKGYRDDQLAMFEQVMRMPEGSILLGNVESCTCGKTGNRWITYCYAQNVGFNTCVSGHREFVWWNTDDGSIAAMQFANPTSKTASMAFCYSGHFFKRYAEREGLGDVDLMLVTEFMRHNAHGVFQADRTPEEPGKYRFDVILNGGIGRGYTSGFYPEDDVKSCCIAHVRTYLPNAMLTPIQRKDTADARDMQASKSRPADTFVRFMLNNDRQGMLSYFADAFEARGMSAHTGRCFADLISQVVEHTAAITLPHGCSESDLRATLLQLYHTYERPAFLFVNQVWLKGQNEHYSMSEVISFAKTVTPDLDLHAFMTDLLHPEPEDKGLIEFIRFESERLEHKAKQGLESGKWIAWKSLKDNSKPNLIIAS